VTESPFRDRIVRPIFIVSSPRSGSTFLFETMARAPDLFTIGGESHRVIENIPQFSVPARGFPSNRLDASDAAPGPVEQLAKAFYAELRDRDGRPASGPVRMLEKTPKNALRVPFFDAAWPECEFVFLYRDVRETFASMAEAWGSGGFRTYPRLPGWTGPPWSMLLVPGWRDLIGLPLAEVIARQWATAMDILVDDLSALAPGRVHAIDYDKLRRDPQASIDRLASRLGFAWDVTLESQLPLSAHTVSRPAPDKWRALEPVIESIWPIVEATDARARAFAESRGA
jgi:hypothetical protein